MTKRLSNRALTILFLLSPAAQAATLGTDEVYHAEGKKTEVYVKDGLVVGGDRAINDVVVRDVRRGANPAGYERIVVDLEGNRENGTMAVARPPFYQVSVDPKDRRVIFTVWGRPKLAMDAKKVQATFLKSASVSKMELFPKMEEESWSFALELKKATPVEVFELANPARVIIDLKNSAPVASAPKPMTSAPKPATRATAPATALEEGESRGFDGVPEDE